MSRMVIAEEAHVVNILPAVDINAGVSTDVFSMKDCSHATIIVSIGVSHAATTITVEECDNFTPTNHPAIAFKVAKEETSLGDTLGSLTAVTDAGFETSANDNIFYVIELDAEDLSEGYPNVRLSFSNPGGVTYVSAVAILTGLCYAGDQNRTQIA
jgi:hypothetical protein